MEVSTLFLLLAACFPISIASTLVLIGVYDLAMHFSMLITNDPDRKSFLDLAFHAIIDNGLEFIVVAGLGLVGVGSGTALVEQDISTLRLIGWHVVICFMSFFLARLLCSGYLFYILGFIGMFCRFAIVGIITFHFWMPHLEVLPVIVAPLFTLLLMLLHRLPPSRRGYLVNHSSTTIGSANHCSARKISFPKWSSNFRKPRLATVVGCRIQNEKATRESKDESKNELRKLLRQRPQKPRIPHMPQL